jgi:ribosomal protein S18 acetylase RimI-like enzyme
MSEHPLDNPLWHSLNSAHAELGTRNGDAARYRPEISAFAGLATPTPAALEDLSKLVDPDGFVLVIGLDEMDGPGPAWRCAEGVLLAQMVCETRLDEPDLPVTVLGPQDVDDMMELVVLTVPGPFERGTIEMGRYMGLREEGRLVAMAGERLKPDGYTEISAVCTHPDVRGRGLGEALVRAVAAPIQRTGDVAFLHVATSNEPAIAVYERLGFRKRAERMIWPLIRLA